MFKHYLRQAIQALKENRLMSVISILGTMLSVAMILVMVLQFQIRQAGYSPVSNRSRMLFIPGISVREKSSQNVNNTGLSAEVFRECLQVLRIPETVMIKANNTHVISLPEKRLFEEYKICYTTPSFWKIFDFHFLHGVPFTEADFSSGLANVVISDLLAVRLFGTEEAVGRDIVIDKILNCKVAGVVKRPSNAAQEAFADVWIAYTSNSLYGDSQSFENMCGSFGAYILARQSSDFEAIKNELRKQVIRYNAGKVDYALTIHDPFTNLDMVLGSGAQGISNRVGWGEYLRTTGLVLLFLLLVPTLNLAGVVQSSVQKRRSEMGLRKAFGATWKRLFVQLIYENMVISLIGGILGICLSIVLIHLCKSFLLSKDTVITLGMLLQPLLCVSALFFTLLLNLLSVGVPVYRMSREQIVDALKDKSQ